MAPTKIDCRLASGRLRDILANFTWFATRNINVVPLPIAGSPLARSNVDGRTPLSDGARDARQLDVGQWATRGELSVKTTVLVILRKEYAIHADILQGDVGELHIVDETLCARDSLDTDAVHGIDDVRITDVDAIDLVVWSATDRTNGDAMRVLAHIVGEMNLRARIDG